jgi:predicted enzyme related to lactoylglutathione lyase
MQLAKITIVTTNTPAMIQFYNAVFSAGLQSTAAFGTEVYRGRIAGMDFMLCPNAVVGIQAQKNRQQLRFRVPNLETLAERIVRYGGSLSTSIEMESDGSLYVAGRDPDGNTIEFVQPSANALM